MLDCANTEIGQLKLKSSPKVATNRYYASSLFPPTDSFAAELDSLNSAERGAQR